MARISTEELRSHLREQFGFVRVGAKAFDEGHEPMIKIAANALVVLLYDKGRTQSMLTQLGVKDRLQFLDTGPPRITSGIHWVTGLVGHVASAEGVRYLPLVAMPPLPVPARYKPFGLWWTDKVMRTMAGACYDRKYFVMTLRDKESAHVDSQLPEDWVSVTRGEKFGFTYTLDDGPEKPFDGNMGYAVVRQIAHEVEQTLTQQLSDLLVP